MKSSRIPVVTAHWKEFTVSQLFDIHPTKAYKVKQSVLFAGSEEDRHIPVISNTSRDNGVIGYTAMGATEQGNILTFSDTVEANTIFYQPVPFVGYAHVQGMYPIEYKEHWNEKTFLFFRSCFSNVVNAYGFDYENKFNRAKALKMKVALPVDSNDDPDWDYMERFVDGILADERKRMEKLKGIRNERAYIDVSQWQEFKISEIFSFDNPKKKFNANKVVIEEEQQDGFYPYVVRTGTHNGIRGYIKEDVQYLNAGKTLSFGQDTATVFYQEEPYFTGDKIKIMTPVDFTMTPEIVQFLLTCLRKSFANYFWGAISFKQSHLEQEKILLPVDDNGVPDWDFMQRFMEDILTQERKRISKI